MNSYFHSEPRLPRKPKTCSVEGCRYYEGRPLFVAKIPASLRHWPFVRPEVFVAQGSVQYVRVVNAVIAADNQTREVYKTANYLAGFKEL